MMPREVSPAQRKSLVESLRPLAGKKTIWLDVPMDVWDGMGFANQLEAAFKEAGWSTSSRIWATWGQPKGLIMPVKDPPSELKTNVALAILNAGLKIRLIPSVDSEQLDDGRITIIIGGKEQ
jgi:hypothetical protein